jgi:hypothetical protein
MRLVAEFTDATFDVASEWEPADGAERLADVFLRGIQVYRQHAAVQRALAEVATYDETVRDFWNGAVGQFTDRTLAVLGGEQDAGRTPADVDPVSATRVIVVGGERAIVDQVATGDPDSDAAFARELALTWWYGVYRRPAEAGGPGA